MILPAGLRVGHAADPALKSGVTVILPDAPSVAAVRVSGGAPATRETDLLRPGNSVEHVDALVLSGGSAFGLAAADGVMAWLAAHGRGFPVAGLRVPIVPAAALFDLANGGDKIAVAGSAGALYSRLGQEACEAATDAPATGSVGAGTGAMTADLKGGFGAASQRLDDGATVTALVAANPVGQVTLGATPHFRAAIFEQAGEFGGLGLPSSIPTDAAGPTVKGHASAGTSTTLAIIATDAELTRGQAHRLAVAAHDGIALAVHPAHTPFDGDTVFALATGLRPLSDRRRGMIALCAAAAATLARAIAVAIYNAGPTPGDRLPTWRERHGGSRRDAG